MIRLIIKGIDSYTRYIKAFWRNVYHNINCSCHIINSSNCHDSYFLKSLRESWSDESGILGSKYFLSYIYTQKLTAVKFNMIRFNKFWPNTSLLILLWSFGKKWASFDKIGLWRILPFKPSTFPFSLEVVLESWCLEALWEEKEDYFEKVTQIYGSDSSYSIIYNNSLNSLNDSLNSMSFATFISSWFTFLPQLPRTYTQRNWSF